MFTSELYHPVFEHSTCVLGLTHVTAAQCNLKFVYLTLTLPGPSAGVSGSLDSYCSLKPLCSGMGKVVPARTSPTLLPPSPRTVLSLSCFKVSQCISCRDWHCLRFYSVLIFTYSSCGLFVHLTLTVPVTTIDAL